VENKRAHLEMIQAVINRMSVNSFQLKGWSVVLISAFFALAAGGSQALFVFLAYFPAIAFWMLDAYFLRQEKLFRKIYDRVRHLAEPDVDFSMDASAFDDEVDAWSTIAFSKTILLFHGTVFGSIVIVMFVIIFTQ
jgi:hypothetical protein